MQLTPSRLIIKGGLSRQVPLPVPCVTTFIHCRACHTGYGLLVLIDFPSAETRAPDHPLQRFQDLVQKESPAEKFQHLYEKGKDVKWIFATTEWIKFSVALKRKTPKCLWRRKQEPFSSRATTRTRGQEATSHADSLACLTANLSCFVPLRRHRRGYTPSHCGAQCQALPPRLCPR